MVSKEDLLKNLREIYCRAKTGSHGVGVFAVRDIAKDIDPFPMLVKTDWIKIKLNEINDLDEEVKKMIYDFFSYEEDGVSVWIPECGLNGINISFFVNHADEPNLYVVEGEEGAVEFRTLREIKKGEELTANYRHYDLSWK